jgi:hypothetical protein
MTTTREAKVGVHETPSDREVVTIRTFDAPRELLRTANGRS